MKNKSLEKAEKALEKALEAKTVYWKTSVEERDAYDKVKKAAEEAQKARDEAWEATEEAWALVLATPEYKNWQKVWKARERASDAYRKILEYKVCMKFMGDFEENTSYKEELQRKGIESWAESIAYAYSDREE